MLCFIGVRHLVNAEPDPDWILRPDTLQGLQILAARSLTLDCVGILPRHWSMVLYLLDACQICAY